MEQSICVAMLGSYPVDTTRIRGGVQAAYTYLVKGLVEIPGLNLHILTFRPPEYQGPDTLQQGSLSTHLLPPYPRFERIRNYHTYQQIVDSKLSQIQPDLIHVQDVAADAYVALRSGYPALLTVHGIRREDRKQIRSWRQRLRHYFDSAFIEKYTLAHVKYLVAVSQYAAGYYRSMLQSDTVVSCIPNAVDERFFCENRMAGENVVLFAGRVTPLKRVMDLVKAFALVVKQIPSAQLRIAGEMSSDRAYVRSIQQWISDARLEQHVHLLGPLPETKILQEFAGCNILALASVQESAPMVIAQAMAASKPVVATRVGGVAEMMGESGTRGILVNAGDIQRLAEAMIHLLEDRDLQAQMGQSGHAFALENFHPRIVARRTADIYQNILMKEQQNRG